LALTPNCSRKAQKSTTPPQAAGYKIGVQPIHSPQAAGNTTLRDLSISGQMGKLGLCNRSMKLSNSPIPKNHILWRNQWQTENSQTILFDANIVTRLGL